MNQEFFLHIENKSIVNTAKLNEVLSSLADGKYLVRINSYKKRSLNQNAYYHGCVVPMVKEGLIHAGYDDVKDNNDAHEVLKHLFLKKKIVNKETGELITEIAGSTAKLTTVEFNFFIEEIIKFGAEFLKIAIPYPNESIVMFADYDNEEKT